MRCSLDGRTRCPGPGRRPGRRRLPPRAAAHEAVLAPLRYDGQTVGAIAVHDRLGEVRGFSTSDVQLLQTIANHASVALHNEMLIGRLRHDALHDTLTGLPNRAQLTARGDRGRWPTARPQRRHRGADDHRPQRLQGGQRHPRPPRRRRPAAPGGGPVRRRAPTGRARWPGSAATSSPSWCPGRSAGDGATVVAERCSTRSTRRSSVGEERLHLSGSAGIALAPEHGTTVSDLLKRADIAMYAAKNGAGLRVALPRRHRPQRPVAALADGRAAGGDRRRRGRHRGRAGRRPGDRPDLRPTEALVRWHHPVRGTLRPGLFLPLAERNGLIVPLTAARPRPGRRGLRGLARADGLDIGDLGQPLGPLAARHDAPADASPTCWTAGTCRADLLTLEITESIVLSDADRALGLLADLRDLGVRLSLDDFGTGYSSLTHLSELPIQQLKIDRSFVSQIHDSPRDRAIVDAVAGLARHLDLEVVAEGIETAGDRRAAGRARLRLGQGHHFAQSMSPELLPLWVQDPGAGIVAAHPCRPPRAQLLRAVR